MEWLFIIGFLALISLPALALAAGGLALIASAVEKLTKK
jgi:hypothetical protein